MSSQIREQKAVARRKFSALLGSLAETERQAGSRELGRRLVELPEWRQAEVVLFFHPLPGEPDLWPLLEQRLEQGQGVALPRYEAAQDRYRACRVVLASGDLRPGRFGILEPAAHCPELDAKHLDLILVPGIGFSLDGVRLGRGKGYYDRLLSGVSGFKCGVAFDCQVTDTLPAESHDTRLNGIMTPTRWLPILARARF